MDETRYPIGSFTYDDAQDFSAGARGRRIQEIADLPRQLADAIQGVRDEELAFRYREGGWTLQQVVHHLPDSHVNGYLRFKLALTESCPVVKAYDEAAWAGLPDSATASLAESLSLVTGLHGRWTSLLRTLSPEDFARTFFHPGAGRVLTLDQALAMYAWHGRHHVAHVRAARARRITAPEHREA